MLNARRIFRYLPPGQIAAVNLLLKQKNLTVEEALERQNEHIFQTSRSFNNDLLPDDAIAWLRFYRPQTGQEWFVTQIDDADMLCLYFDGEFNVRFYNPQDVKMKLGVVFDIFWEPKPFGLIRKVHVSCEDSKRKRIDYAHIMRKGNFREYSK